MKNSPGTLRAHGRAGPPASTVFYPISHRLSMCSISVVAMPGYFCFWPSRGGRVTTWGWTAAPACWPSQSRTLGRGRGHPGRLCAGRSAGRWLARPGGWPPARRHRQPGRPASYPGSRPAPAVPGRRCKSPGARWAAGAFDLAIPVILTAAGPHPALEPGRAFRRRCGTG